MLVLRIVQDGPKNTSPKLYSRVLSFLQPSYNGRKKVNKGFAFMINSLQIMHNTVSDPKLEKSLELGQKALNGTYSDPKLGQNITQYPQSS